MNSPSRLAVLEQYLAADPGNVILMQDAARAAMSEGRLDRAQEIIESAQSCAPTDDGVKHLAAHLKLAEQKYAEAEAMLRDLWSTHGSPVLLSDLLYALTRQEKYREVVDLAKNVVDTQPPFAPVSFHYVRALHHLGDMEAAVAHLDHYAAAGGIPDDLLGAASLAYFDADRMVEAGVCAERALKLNPNYYEAVLVDASVRLARGDRAGAKSGFEQAERLHSGGGRSQAGLGMLRMLDGQLVDAEQHLARAAQAMPGHVGSWVALGWVQVLGERLDAARQSTHRAMEVNPRFAEVHGLLAVIEALSGNADEAQHAITRARRLDASGFSSKYAEMVLAGTHRDAASVSQAAQGVISRLGMGGMARPQ